MEYGEPIATTAIDGRIIEAKCSLCDETLELGHEVGSKTDQRRKMSAAFQKHVKEKHPPKRARVSGRIVVFNKSPKLQV